MKKIPYILQFQKDMDYVILLRFFVFSLLYCKYIRDIYLSMLDFNGLCKFKNIFIYMITVDIQQLWANEGMTICRSI